MWFWLFIAALEREANRRKIIAEMRRQFIAGVMLKGTDAQLLPLFFQHPLGESVGLDLQFRFSILPRSLSQ
jgi:hypothetical protein